MASGSAAAAAVERYVRACPEHLEALAELECPRGHQVERWLILDRTKGTVTRGGELDSSPRGTSMPRGVPGSGPTSSAKPGTKSLDRRGFGGPGGATMLIGLERKTLKDQPVQFRVHWRTLKGAQQTGSGYTYVGINEPDARDAFSNAEREALAQNWARRFLGREPEIKPIPAAPKK